MSFIGTLKALISDTVSVDIRADASTHSLQTIDYAHHEIHGGDAYHASFHSVTANTDDHRTAIGLVTSDTTKWMHIVVSASAASAAEFFVLEAPTIDDDAGTQKAIYNRNRNSANVSLATDISASPTAGTVETYIEAELATLAGGTEIEQFNLVAGSGAKTIGGSARGQAEWMLDQGATYLFIIQNVGASANLHEIHLNWYEHTDRS